MISLALNSENDMLIDPRTGSFAMVSDGDEVCQHVKTRLLFFLGEWFLDTSVGMPYFQEIFGPAGDLSAIEGRIKSEIINTPGVESLDKFEMKLNSRIRTLTASFSATTVYGKVSSSLTLNKVTI